MNGNPEGKLRGAMVLLRTLVLVFVGFCVVIFALQRSMMFYPQRADRAAMERSAAAAGLLPWELDGRLIGWKTREGGQEYPMLVLHGNAGHAAHRGYLSSLLQSVAPEPMPAVYILEYPGYGSRDGSPSERAFVEAAVEAMEALAAEGAGKIILVGESIGSGVAAGAAAERPALVGGLLMITPFNSMVSLAKHHYPFLPVGLLLRDRFESSRNLRGLEAPMVVILAERDNVVPARFGRKLYEDYEGPKLIIEAPASGHNELLDHLPDDEWRRAIEFLR